LLAANNWGCRIELCQIIVHKRAVLEAIACSISSGNKNVLRNLHMPIKYRRKSTRPVGFRGRQPIEVFSTWNNLITPDSDDWKVNFAISSCPLSLSLPKQWIRMQFLAYSSSSILLDKISKFDFSYPGTDLIRSAEDIYFWINTSRKRVRNEA
jgi:hypothetical protein